MQVPFTAYADDCTVTGELAFDADRLSDFLASTTEFEIGAPAFKALDDGRVVSAESCSVLRDDFCVIIATGPRGKADRRLWTRQQPVRARLGPYVVLGYLHGPPTIDPIRMASRRPIVALTSGVLEYAAAGETIRVESEAILLNSSRIEMLEPAGEQDIGPAASLELGALGISALES
jgi:hypothetical protein